MCQGRPRSPDFILVLTAHVQEKEDIDVSLMKNRSHITMKQSIYQLTCTTCEKHTVMNKNDYWNIRGHM